MKFCPNCGNQVDDSTNFCPKCGFAIPDVRGSEVPQPTENVATQIPVQPEQSTMNYTQAPAKKKQSGLGIAAFVLTLTVALAPIGFILSIVDLIKNRQKKHTFSIIALILSIILMAFAPRLINSASKRSANGSQSTTNGTSISAEKAEDTAPLEATNVFYIDLVNEIDQYNGKYIETSLPVSSILSDGEITVNKNIDTSIKVKTNKSYYEKRDSIDYITVRGTISKSSSGIEIKKAEVLYAGKNVPDDYAAGYAQYEYIVRLVKTALRESFIKDASSPSWDDLARYPDTYKDQHLCLDVKITKVEADSWLSNGTVWAKYGGKEIIIYDNRDLREPRFQEGDRITIYATGDGLVNIKTYEQGTGIFGSSIGADVVGTRDVPAVKLLYTAVDDTSKFGVTGAKEENQYYIFGKETLSEP